MYLILPKQEAEIRNITEAIRRNQKLDSTNKQWREIELEDGRNALDVGEEPFKITLSNGDVVGLTDAEIEGLVADVTDLTKAEWI